MDTLFNLLVFLGAFIGMVLVHELGHFLAARLCKIDVEEFGFGLPPRILTMFRRGGTDFTLNWLPFGGFVRMKGDTDPGVPGGFGAAKPVRRLVVLLAGVTMNLLAGFLLFSIVIYLQGRPVDRVLIAEVTAGLPADQAGLKVGDVIAAIDGEAMTSVNQVHDTIYAHLDQPITLSIERGGGSFDVTVTPLSAIITENQGPTGILTGYVTEAYRSWFAALPDAARETGRLIYELMTLPAKLLRGALPAEQARLVGLKGIYDFTSAAINSDLSSRASSDSLPTYYTLQLIVLLNFSLAVFNLLPFPALDGARALFVLPELIFRKRVPFKVENAIHMAGMALLLAFMLYVNVMDFVRPVQIVLP